jgi:ubiquitin C-terminal hydrolase
LKSFSGLLALFDYDEIENSEKLREQRDYYAPQGLPNIGNTCYMNALLQMLSGSRMFMEFIHKLWVSLKLNKDDQLSIMIIRLLELLINLQ